jgi:hypothetical protein
MLEGMVKRLREDNGVIVPTFDSEDSDFNLYVVDYGELYTGEESKKYIPDPLLVMIKAASSVFAHYYGDKINFLPASKSVTSEGST